MKTFFYVLLVILFSACTNSRREINKNGELRVEIKVRGYYSLPNLNFYLLDLRLFNPSNDTIRFWSNKCSYFLNIYVDSDNFELAINRCNTDFPVLFELKPNQVIEMPLIVRKINKSNNASLRVGFIFIKEEQFSLELNYFEVLRSIKKSGKQILWSKEVNLFLNEDNPYIFCP